jgi:type I restriction enzyme S subunit
MTSDVDVEKIEKVAFFQEGPGILAKDFHEQGVPLLRLKSIEGPYSTLRGCNYLDPEKVRSKWNHFKTQKGDLLISTSASLGRVSIVTAETEGAIPYTGIVRFRSKSNRLLDNYLRAFLSSKEFIKQAQGMASGSVISHFGPTHIKQMTISLPSIKQQEFIGNLYSSFDEKIRALQNQNTALESISKTIFRSWFVRFEPVHAKAAGNSPEAMSTDLASLFPSELAESELGRIPMGWKLESLDAQIGYLNGLALQKFPPIEGEPTLPVIKISQLKAGQGDSSILANRRMKPEFIVKDGDIIFSWSGSLALRIWTGGEGALNQHLFKVSSESLPPWFCFQATLLHLASFKETAASKATTMGHIQRHHLTEAKVAIPPDALLSRMSEVFEPMFKSIVINGQSIKSLERLRDHLLPRLISGKFRIEDAEAALAEIPSGLETEPA